MENTTADLCLLEFSSCVSFHKRLIMHGETCTKRNFKLFWSIISDSCVEPLHFFLFSPSVGQLATFPTAIHTVETEYVTLVSFRQIRLATFSTSYVLPLGINHWTKETRTGDKHNQNCNGTISIESQILKILM